VKYLGDGESGDPDGLLYGVDANVPVSAHVGVKYFRQEAHLFKY
jgi:hypothetical protein